MDLEKLRLLNQDLLQKLKANQEAFRKQVPSSTTLEKEKESQDRDSQSVVPVPSAEASGSSQGKEAAPGGRPRVRMPPAPKPVLLTPHQREKPKKEAPRVTFVSGPEERAAPSGRSSARPFLGYDWIAGLLEMDSSITEKPDQYFSELQEFRRVNREDCLVDRESWLESSDASSRDTDPTSHQCVFCYRINKRLFPEPMGPEPACAVCRTPRARKPPETLVEPAFVRVSVPRATLLPAYKHKIHRRKSFDPAGDLALPSHCLAGWEEPVRTFSPALSSLDLRSSLTSRTTDRSKKERSPSTGVTGVPGSACVPCRRRSGSGTLSLGAGMAPTACRPPTSGRSGPAPCATAWPASPGSALPRATLGGCKSHCPRSPARSGSVFRPRRSCRPSTACPPWTTSGGSSSNQGRHFSPPGWTTYPSVQVMN
ncbi:migration and invasion-inhibitory protein isoform X2 [Anolis carolinensis]